MRLLFLSLYLLPLVVLAGASRDKAEQALVTSGVVRQVNTVPGQTPTMGPLTLATVAISDEVDASLSLTTSLQTVYTARAGMRFSGVFRFTNSSGSDVVVTLRMAYTGKSAYEYEGSPFTLSPGRPVVLPFAFPAGLVVSAQASRAGATCEVVGVLN